jgi:hypothetical protein
MEFADTSKSKYNNAVFKVSIVKRPPTADKILKSIHAGMAIGITKTAVEGKQAVQGAIRGTFQVRNQWPEKGPLAVKSEAAKIKDRNPTATVGAGADFLALHEKGGTKIPRGEHLAVPTENVRRTKRQIIQKGQRPRPILAKGAFVGKTRKGREFIAQRQGRGKNKKFKILYFLPTRARIKKQPTFFPVIQKVVNRRLHSNIQREIKAALQNIR